MRRPWPTGGCCAKRKKERMTNRLLVLFVVLILEFFQCYQFKIRKPSIDSLKFIPCIPDVLEEKTNNMH
jgi:hypothetical protein